MYRLTLRGELRGYTTEKEIDLTIARAGKDCEILESHE